MKLFSAKSLKPISHYFKQDLEKTTTYYPEFSSSRFVSQFRTSPVHFGPQNSLKENDKIEKLPGQPEGVDFNQYSGYVTVDPSAGRALFYYFVESPQDSASKPLVLWLNGGPGCSSLGGGAFGELGPFRVNKDGTLQRNQFSWISEANIIFLESPAGVGFSYTNTSSDYNFSGDRTTARDSYTFLVNWLERFPEYKASEFYLTGESYAGHYVPQLAQLILLHNNYPNKTMSTINLKGIAIGNAYVDFEANMKGTTEYYWSHALISDELYNNIISTCNFSTPSSASKKCNAGDMDIVVPVTDTRYAIKKLKTSVKTAWYPWYLQGEVGGYVEEYENLTLVTIRGAGHFVPTYQPNRALAFFSHFLSGKLPPKE
ncbi:hypothetical protein RND71_031544 [Anisodus tanguticus]|uniref:Carboxypeptidase n=1 Tax=Anisodus tanguticus TaxID=243964 RepID=A0AAE1V4X1_9SOLA|nr:hypothetical protein RND71_031544 [Anisodus tanguticus]